MGALFSQHNRTPNGRTTMTNTAKNSATPKTVAEKAAEVKTEETTVPAQATATEKNSVEEPKETEATAESEKLTLVQRAKAKVERLKKNKKAIIALAVSAAVFGVVVNNKRRNKAVDVETLDPEDTTVIGVGDDDESTDSV